MKKIIPVLTLGTILSSSIVLVSCGLQRGENYSHYGDVQVITDTGSVEDKSFNESGYQAATAFSNILCAQKPDGKVYTHGYSQPQYKTENSIQKSYISSIKNGSKILLLPGFLHQNTGHSEDFAIKNHTKYPDAKYIVVDAIPSKYDDQKLALKGWYKLNFAAEESGFLSAIYAGIYFIKKEDFTEAEVKLATYGGLQIDGVTPFMDGWLQGINWFNKNRTPEINRPIKPIFAYGEKASEHDFTQGFAPGLATSLSKDYIKQGANVIMPIAGPQTGDTIGVIASEKKQGKVYVIAPDTDQSATYDPKYLMGTAIKGVYAASLYALTAITKNPGLKPFKLFKTSDMNDANFEGWSEFIKKTRNKLSIAKENDYSIKSKTMVTGFLPSEWLTKDYKLKRPVEVNDDILNMDQNDLYIKAKQFMNTGAVLRRLTEESSVANANAQETFKKYGGFASKKEGE